MAVGPIDPESFVAEYRFGPLAEQLNRAGFNQDPNFLLKALLLEDVAGITAAVGAHQDAKLPNVEHIFFRVSLRISFLYYIVSIAAKAGINFFDDPKIESVGSKVAGSEVALPRSLIGTDMSVRELLATKSLHRLGLDGDGVRVAVPDTGVYIYFLGRRGHGSIQYDSRLSDKNNEEYYRNEAGDWLTDPPGVACHGTTSAFSVTLAAPRFTLIDYLILGKTKLFSNLLSDAIAVYNRL